MQESTNPKFHSLFDDVSFQKKAKSIMIQELPKVIEQLCIAFNCKDYDTVVDIAHKMRPNLLLIGFPEQSTYMEDIEKNTDRTLLQLPFIKKELEYVLSKLSELKD